MHGKHASYHSKLVDPTAYLILRLARGIESDHLLAHHGDGLQIHLCTKILLEFFKLVQYGDGYPNSPQSLCTNTNLIAPSVNLGHLEEDAICNHTLQSLITHLNLYDHQADGFVILFKLASTTPETYADCLVVDHCFDPLKDYDCHGSAKRELTGVRVPAQRKVGICFKGIFKEWLRYESVAGNVFLLQYSWLGK